MPDAHKEFQIYLQPTEFINSDSREVMEYAKAAAGDKILDIDMAASLYYAVRDDIMYDPYRWDVSRHGLKASTVLKKRVGFCVQKAILLAAAARVMGIPSRLHFADVKNHLTSKRLYEMMQSDIFLFHAYTELYLGDKWVKATPAFNLSLCQLTGVAALEFDGRSDSMFQQFDREGKRYMEYVNDRGYFADVPYYDLVKTFKEVYPKMMDQDVNDMEGDFAKEIEKN